MSVKTAYLFGSGEYGEGAPALEPGALVIAADGGLARLNALGIRPGLIVGDFDSYRGALPAGVETVRRPVMKDETDMELAVRAALERGAGRIVLYGGLGGRLDHSFANLQLLAMLARRGAEGYLAGRAETVTAVCRRVLCFSPAWRGTVSVFAYGGAARVTETGLLYPLSNARLEDDRPLGVSNEFTGVPARVTVHEGTALIMWGTENPGFPQLLEV